MFEEYLRQGEPNQTEKANLWKTAIGLQEVDGLKPSQYLIDTARENIEGYLTFAEVKQRLDGYYQQLAVRDESRTEEADKVSARIAEMLSEQTFGFSISEYLSIHRRLFQGIYPDAGQLRTFNISKKEWILNGETVLYGSADSLRETLEYDFDREKKFSYKGLNQTQIIEHLALFIADLWQIHPFSEGNTRTTAIFLIKYLRKLGYKQANNAQFEQHAWYFRNALVRANFEDLSQGIYRTNEFLIKFFDNWLFGNNEPLKNREMRIELSKHNQQE